MHIDVQALKRRIPILAVVQQTVELRQRRREWWGLYPLHAERTPSFAVNPEKGVWRCFGCGQGGDVIRFVKQARHLSFRDAVQADLTVTGARCALRGT